MIPRTDVESRTSGRLDAVTWLTVYVCLLFFVPSRLIVAPLGSAGSPSMIFGLASLILWLVFCVGATRVVKPGVQPIRVALCAFLFSVGLSYALAMSGPINSDEISPADVALLALASWSGTLLMAHDGVPNRARLDTLVWRITLCGGVIAMLGIVQVITRQVWVDRITMPGLNSADAAATFWRGAFLRPAATAIHPIEFGVVVTMLLPLALHVAFSQTWRNSVVRWIPALVLAAVIPMTSSRSAYVGVFVGMVICIVGWPAARRRLMTAVGLVGIVAMSVVTPTLLKSIVGLFTGVSDDTSIASRTNSFDLATEFVARNPLFGRGPGTFLPKYRIFDNQYLGLLVTVGLIGTILFIGLGIVTVVTVLRFRRNAANERSRDLAISLVASVAVGFVGLVMFDAFAFPMTMGTLFLLLGVSGALRKLEGEAGGLSVSADLVR